MPKQKNRADFNRMISTAYHEKIRWANELTACPIDYSILEFRVMCLITILVKRYFKCRELDQVSNWEGLSFKLTNEDLAFIGGNKNINNTYEVLNNLGKKFVRISKQDENGKTTIMKVHWIDTFYYEPDTESYIIRISPEIRPYLIGIKNNFTEFDAGSAMMMQSKYSHKMLVLCSRYSGNYRYKGNLLGNGKKILKQRIAVIDMDVFRTIMGLDEVSDLKTGKIVKKGKEYSFKEIRKKILEPAQKELYMLYKEGGCDLYLDYQAGPRKGLGGKVSSVVIYIYTRKHPKQGEDRPWQEGDYELDPYEIRQVSSDNEGKLLTRALNKSILKDFECLENSQKSYYILSILERYLKGRKLNYYMTLIDGIAVKTPGAYYQIMECLIKKTGQKKFNEGNAAYKSKAITHYALNVNLKEQYNWFIPEYEDMIRKIRKNRQ